MCLLLSSLTLGALAHTTVISHLDYHNSVTWSCLDLQATIPMTAQDNSSFLLLQNEVHPWFPAQQDFQAPHLALIWLLSVLPSSSLTGSRCPTTPSGCTAITPVVLSGEPKCSLPLLCCKLFCLFTSLHPARADKNLDKVQKPRSKVTNFTKFFLFHSSLQPRENGLCLPVCLYCGDMCQSIDALSLVHLLRY